MHCRYEVLKWACIFNCRLFIYTNETAIGYDTDLYLALYSVCQGKGHRLHSGAVVNSELVCLHSVFCVHMM